MYIIIINGTQYVGRERERGTSENRVSTRLDVRRDFEEGELRDREECTRDTRNQGERKEEVYERRGTFWPSPTDVTRVSDLAALERGSTSRMRATSLSDRANDRFTCNEHQTLDRNKCISIIL